MAERRQLGGSCVSFGCTPTKAAIASARLAHQIRGAGDFGIRTDGAEVDFSAVLDRAQRIRDGMRGSLADALGKGDNPRLIDGHARFAGRTNDGFRVTVAEDEVIAGHLGKRPLAGGLALLPPRSAPSPPPQPSPFRGREQLAAPPVCVTPIGSSRTMAAGRQANGRGCASMCVYHRIGTGPAMTSKGGRAA